MLGRVDVSRPQVRDQQVIAAEHIERQKAVVVIIAVEEPSFLGPVHRVIGGVKVEHDLLRWAVEGGDEGLQKDLMHRPRPAAVGGVLEPAQSRRAGQRPIALGRRLHGEVVAQGGVVIDVLIAKGDRHHPLAQHVDEAVAHLAGLAIIPQPAGHRRRQAQPTIRLAQQQRPAVRGHLATVKPSLHPALATGWQ